MTQRQQVAVIAALVLMLAGLAFVAVATNVAVQVSTILDPNQYSCRSPSCTLLSPQP